MKSMKQKHKFSQFLGQQLESFFILCFKMLWEDLHENFRWLASSVVQVFRYPRKLGRQGGAKYVKQWSFIFGHFVPKRCLITQW